MGGNALKNTFIRRYDREEYEKLSEKIIYTLKHYFDICSISTLVSYRQKESFGDMDILVHPLNQEELTTTSITNIFQPNEIIKNGDVISFDVEELQIDLIIVSDADDYKTMYAYYAYNDLGNLIGKVAKKLGFTYGQKGLEYSLMHRCGQLSKVSVSKNIAEILDFLGYSPEAFFIGFDTLEDVFKYAASSKYFDKNIYQFENRTGDGKRRDSKRSVYKKFLEWLETYKETEEQERNINVNTHIFFTDAINRFPDFKDAYTSTMLEHIKRNIIKSKFNGDIIAYYTNLNGAQLGNFIKNFREFVLNNWNHSFDDFVFICPPEYMGNLIEKFYNNTYTKSV